MIRPPKSPIVHAEDLLPPPLVKDRSRGFKKLKGLTITKVDASCSNVVVLWDDKEQYAYWVEAEVFNGVPRLTCNRMDIDDIKAISKRKAPRPADSAWPYPPAIKPKKEVKK